MSPRSPFAHLKCALRFVVVLALAWGSVACTDSFASIYGSSASLTGTRVVANPGLSTTELDWQDAALEWIVTPNGSLWDYQYTFTGFNQPGISHFLLDITDDVVHDNEPVDPNAVTNAELNGITIPLQKIEFKNFESGITGAVKFDEGEEFAGTGDPLVYTFTSNRSPVWGDLFIKGGQSNLTNTGINNHASDNVLDFIARPNGQAIIPEASTMIIWSLLIGFGVSRRSRSAA